MGIALDIPESIQRELRYFDPRLRIAWSHKQNLFVIQQRSKLDGRWTPVLYWAGCDAKGRWVFRNLPGTAQPIIERLARMDVKKIAGATPEARDLYFSRLEGQRKAQAHQRTMEWAKLGAQYFPDFAARTGGVRQTFGPGPLRSRKMADNSSEVFQAAVKALAKKPAYS